MDEARAFLASRPLLAFRGHRRRAAAGAEAASAALGRGRQRALDPPRRRARLQSDPRSICQRRSSSASASASTKPSARRAACGSIRCRSRWRASSMWPRTKPTNRPRWSRQAAYTKRTVDVSRAPGRRSAARMCSPMPDKAGGTEENAMYGTPEEICAMLEALREAGVAYVLLIVAGGSEQLRRFARDIMPAFARSPPRPTPRNDGLRPKHGRHSQTPRRQGGRRGDWLGARRGQDARARRPRHQARDRPRRAMGCDARSVGAFRRHALRAGGTGAVGESRHAARRDRSAGGGEQAGTRLRADGLCGRARRDSRRRHASAA